MSFTDSGLFFGWFGAHKFMEKKIGVGILYLFTFGTLLNSEKVFLKNQKYMLEPMVVVVHTKCVNIQQMN